jgi:Icc-related predicted phosphoesterase
MTRILAIADEIDEAMYGDKLERLRPDLVLACGDLPFDYLEYIVSRLNAPLVYVPGNHDPDVHWSDPKWTALSPEAPIPGPQGCDNADGKVISAAGLRIAGLGGSMRYKPGPNQYTDSEMRWRALKLEVRTKLSPVRRAQTVDVLLTHAPPIGGGPPDDLAHRGFVAFERLIKVLAPKLLVHGHVHPYGHGNPERRVGGTRIVNAVPSVLIEI